MAGEQRGTAELQVGGEDRSTASANRMCESRCCVPSTGSLVLRYPDIAAKSVTKNCSSRKEIYSETLLCCSLLKTKFIVRNIYII